MSNQSIYNDMPVLFEDEPPVKYGSAWRNACIVLDSVMAVYGIINLVLSVKESVSTFTLFPVFTMLVPMIALIATALRSRPAVLTSGVFFVIIAAVYLYFAIWLTVLERQLSAIAEYVMFGVFLFLAIVHFVLFNRLRKH